jgi:hypothetical protein
VGRVRGGAGLRDRLRRLEEAAREETMTLVCPACGVEFVAYGDVPMEFIVHEWAAETGKEGHHETPEGILRIFAHGHDPGAFLKKGSGLPFPSREISGINIGATPTHLGPGGDGGA